CEAGIILAENDSLQPTIAGHEFQFGRQKWPVVFAALGVEQMDRCDITLATFSRGKSAGAAHIKGLHRYAFAPRPGYEHYEANTMAADHDEIGQLRLAKQLHLDRCACGYAFDMLPDGDEAVGLAERHDGARTLARRISCQWSAVATADQRH